MTVLLLTAHVTPAPDAANHTQFDPAERIADYAGALEFYQSIPPDEVRLILFCENSGKGAEDVRARLSPAETAPELLMHSYESPVPPRSGKGRGELELIDRGMDILAPLLRPGEAVWKITGRLQVTNIRDLIRTQPDRFALYADFRHVPLIGDSLGGNDWVDMRCFAFTAEGHDRYLKDRWSSAWIGVEKWLYREAVADARGGGTGGVVPRLRRQPYLSGTSGGSGADYASLPYRAKDALRTVTRKLLPGLWL